MWYDEMDGPGPIDSYDAYQMGLRPARCNGCRFAQLKHELGDKFLHLEIRGWHKVFELDAEPVPGQAQPLRHRGRSIRSVAAFLGVGHSDECYNWQPPKST
jgi:hypothetical protein